MNLSKDDDARQWAEAAKSNEMLIIDCSLLTADDIQKIQEMAAELAEQGRKK